MKAQIIEKNGRPEFAGREFLVPDEIMRRELAGESPIILWREHRGLTQQELATRAGISKPYLSQIETGKRQGTVRFQL